MPTPSINSTMMESRSRPLRAAGREWRPERRPDVGGAAWTIGPRSIPGAPVLLSLPRTIGVQPRLEDDRGGRLVHHAPPLSAPGPRSLERAIRLRGRQPFVLHGHGNREER